MNSCSKPGMLYSIECTTTNTGIPYADSFHVQTHFCLKSISKNETKLVTFVRINYKKNAWAIVKSKELITFRKQKKPLLNHKFAFSLYRQKLLDRPRRLLLMFSKGIEYSVRSDAGEYRMRERKFTNKEDHHRKHRGHEVHVFRSVDS